MHPLKAPKQPIKASASISTLLIVFGIGMAQGAELPTAKPERVGVSSERLMKLDDVGRKFVADGKYSGIVTIVSRRGKVIHFGAHGRYGITNDKPIEKDTLFRIYSMTKPVTAVAAMMLYEDGLFQMTDPVANFLPELADLKLQRGDVLAEPRSQMTMRQLLTHTAGLTYGFYADNPVDLSYRETNLFGSLDLDEFITKLSQLPLRYEPGTRYHYSVAFDVLGAVVEKISGQSLEEFFDQRIFQPLGMVDTFFSVPADKTHRLADIHAWDAAANKLIVLPKQYDRSYTDVTLFSGGGGLVSTAGDYLRFCEMLLRGGSFQGVRLLGPKTVQFMISDHLTPEVRAEGVGEYPRDDLYPGQSMGIGFGVITNPAITPSISSLGEYSWGGLGGTKFWIDPVEEIVGIAMVQLVQSPWPLRFSVKVATYQALTEVTKP